MRHITAYIYLIEADRHYEKYVIKRKMRSEEREGIMEEEEEEEKEEVNTLQQPMNEEPGKELENIAVNVMNI